MWCYGNLGEILNVIFLVIAGFLIARFLKTRGPETLKMM